MRESNPRRLLRHRLSNLRNAFPEKTEKERSDLLQGTLDMLILKIVALGPVHGYAISLRIRQISRDVLQVQQGSLYPALHRLEKRGWLLAEWGESENGAASRRR